jgi:hypothetical protein
MQICCDSSESLGRVAANPVGLQTIEKIMGTSNALFNEGLIA